MHSEGGAADAFYDSNVCLDLRELQKGGWFRPEFTHQNWREPYFIEPTKFVVYIFRSNNHDSLS